MSDHVKQLWESFSKNPWINRVLLMFIIWFGKEFYYDVQQMKVDVNHMRTDIEVMKREIQLLTDYKIDPKNTGE